MSECQPDIRVSRRTELQQEPSPSRLLAETTGNGIIFTCPYGGLRYQIRNGQEIIVLTTHKREVELERLPLYGFAMATVLQQRANLVLHASAVEINGKAMVFIGGKTFGKSTLVASLVSRGCRLLSDDVTGLVMHHDKIKVLSGIGCLKLWPDAMHALGLSVDEHPKLYADTTKRYYLVNQQFSHSERELDTVFFLSHAHRLGINQLRGVEKMLHLTESCYLSKFQNLLSPEEHRESFGKCADLAKRVTIVKLSRPRDLALLNDTCRLIEEYVAAG